MKLLIGLSILGNVILAVKLMRFFNKYNQEIEECNEELYDQGKEIDDLQFQLTEKESYVKSSNIYKDLLAKETLKLNEFYIKNKEMEEDKEKLEKERDRMADIKNEYISKLEKENNCMVEDIEQLNSELNKVNGEKITLVENAMSESCKYKKKLKAKEDELKEVIESRDNYKGYMNFILNSPRDIRRKFAKGENIPYVVDGEVKMLVVKEGE